MILFSGFFTDFLKNWLPSVAIILGGTWILFKWIYDEINKSKKEITALDGDLTAKVYPYSKDHCIVSISMAWNSRSPIPLFVDINSTRVEVHELSNDLPVGVIDVEINPLPNVITFRPFADYGTLVLEPNSTSVFRNHFVLKRGKTYIAQYHLIGKKDDEYWFKETVILTDPILK